MVHGAQPIGAPSEEPLTERAQLSRAQTLRDEGRRADPQLDSGGEHEASARHAILANAMHGPEVVDPPLPAVVGEPCMAWRRVSVDYPHRAVPRCADKPRAKRWPGEHVDRIRTPFA